MNKENFIILKYQNNYIDNLINSLFGLVLENLSNKQCVYENLSDKREILEDFLLNFDLKFDYLSTFHIDSLKKKCGIINNEKKLIKNLNKKKFDNKNIFLDIKTFNLENFPFLINDIKKIFTYKNLDFIINFDILENITKTNSIGIYINEKDYSEVDFDFIDRALIRLNKYIKQPRIFIFCDSGLKKDLKLSFNYSIVNTNTEKEEFYFLSKCKYKIIPDLKNSKNKSLLATFLGKKSSSIDIIQRKNTIFFI